MNTKNHFDSNRSRKMKKLIDISIIKFRYLFRLKKVLILIWIFGSACLGYSQNQVPQKVLNAALHGPQLKKVSIKELKSSTTHEFNVKPVSMSVTPNGDLIVFGFISHHITGKKDDQYYFGFKKVGGKVIPNDPEQMIESITKGGFIKTIGLSKPLGKLVAVYYGQNADKYYDWMDDNADLLDFIALDKGHEKAVYNYLLALSKTIKQPRPLQEKRLVLYTRYNYKYKDKGKRRVVKVGENISNLETLGLNDNISSLHVVVPKGMQLELFIAKNYRDGTGKLVLLEGSHYIKDMGCHKMNDKLSSIKWSKVGHTNMKGFIN